MKEKPNYYGIIPARVRYSKKITPNAKLLYAEITALSHKDGNCWASNKYFANLYEVSAVTISRWISSLVKHNFIKRKIIYIKDTKQIDKRYLQLCYDTINNSDTTPLDDIVKGNNTSSNNTRSNKINIEIRKINFKNQVSLLDYPVGLQKEFCDYWCEQNQSKTKMKFEMQKTFDVNLRLKRWCKNNQNWNKPKTMSKLDSQINAWQEAKKLL